MDIHGSGVHRDSVIDLECGGDLICIAGECSCAGISNAGRIVSVHPPGIGVAGEHRAGEGRGRILVQIVFIGGVQVPIGSGVVGGVVYAEVIRGGGGDRRPAGGDLGA